MMRAIFVLSALTIVTLAPGSRADIAAPSPVAERVARAKVIVVGKVTAIENKTAKIVPWWGGTEKLEFQVAVVKVDDLLAGPKGLTHVKVGFLPRSQLAEQRGRPRTDLRVDQEVCLLLMPHPTEPIFFAPMYYDLIDRSQPGAAAQIDEARRYAKLLADPGRNLESKDADTRYFTAAMLVLRYRMVGRYGPKPMTTEPIPADESRRILDIIAEANWKRNDAAVQYHLAPSNVFNALGATPKEGWTPPRDFRQMEAAAKKWLKENSEKFRIQRFVEK